MNIMRLRRVGAGLSFACTLLVSAPPAQATRGIVIDVASQTNALTSCGNDCQSLDLSNLGTAVPVIDISSHGSISFGSDGYLSTFDVAESAVTYEVLSGYTIDAQYNRTDFIDFYSPGRDTSVGLTGNRPPPNFQIQLQNVGNGIGLGGNLQIAFAYLDPTSFGGNLVPDGATIGYSSDGLGLVSGPYGPFAGNPSQQLITNSNGLLLGEQPTDSDFAFVIGTQPDINFNPVNGLISETFSPRYAATAAVPEPATWVIMLVGFGAIGASLRRRRVRAIV